MEMLQTAMSVAGTMITILATLGALARRGVQRFRDDLVGRIETLRAENTAQHAETEAALGEQGGKLDSLTEGLRGVTVYFDPSGPVARSVGTLPDRVKTLEEEVHRLG